QPVHAAQDKQLHFQKVRMTGFEFPPLSLLDSPSEDRQPVSESVLKKNAQLLEAKLKDYDVEGRVTEIHPGPVVTMYEFEPVAGTKVNKIVNLESDLSLSMGGKSVRVVPHLPGKAALGIEIPNHERETVRLKEILESPSFQKSKSALTLGLGKDIEGHPVVSDLTRMPHLLIAGATGAGKSVGLHSMITSMIYKSTPEDVRMILVDPKRLEMNVYDGIPHLLLPVVTEPKQAVAALRWAVREMERRYRILADAGARHISGYNEKIKNGSIAVVTEEEAEQKLQENKEAICHTGKLQYIVIIVDELADMMMAASREFEETITRLAQMARAAGIHLILATQRPSVDVITGLIKANFPTRISYKVSAKHDSRTILDQIGAETLLGNGDMLFMPPNAPNLIRIHGALVTESEIGRVVGHLKEQAEPVYDMSLLETPVGETNGLGAFDEEDNQLYDQAVRIVSEARQASISMIQRRLKIGYNRAARMIEKMEAEGVIGPQDGAKPREVLVGSMETS
ncbi:MAG: DNA translocase FtsK, partial [Deltaproteobacteria bacterium]|nr:DNA translocase FtsK [Deltaproteobacteria bacterium]